MVLLMVANVLDAPAAASTQKTEAVSFFETFVPAYQSTLSDLEVCHPRCVVK